MGYWGRNKEAKRLVDAATPRWQHVKRRKASLKLATPDKTYHEEGRSQTRSLTHEISPPHPTSHPSQMTLVKLAPFLTLVVALDYYFSFSEKTLKHIQQTRACVVPLFQHTVCFISHILPQKPSQTICVGSS